MRKVFSISNEEIAQFYIDGQPLNTSNCIEIECEVPASGSEVVTVGIDLDWSTPLLSVLDNSPQNVV